MGSVAYGVSSDTSDMDLYGFAIPPKEDVFPHLGGEIMGFGRQKKRFEQYQEHHIRDDLAMGGSGREYDISVFNIVKYFQLAMENNPNMIDSLFTPLNCLVHITKVGNMVREKRKLFLHKGAWHKFKGYAYSQLNKMSEKLRVQVREFESRHGIPSSNYLDERLQQLRNYRDGVIDAYPIAFATMSENDFDIYRTLVARASETPQGKRKPLVEKYGYDVKFAYHVIRLLNEVQQILLDGDIDLCRNSEELKSIRRGEWTEEDLRRVAADREHSLEDVYNKSTLRHSPDEEQIKALLLQCLEEHYGSLDKCIVSTDRIVIALRNIRAEIEQVESLL
jgi:hypothetical protein